MTWLLWSWALPLLAATVAIVVAAASGLGGYTAVRCSRCRRSVAATDALRDPFRCACGRSGATLKPCNATTSPVLWCLVAAIAFSSLVTVVRLATVRDRSPWWNARPPVLNYQDSLLRAPKLSRQSLASFVPEFAGEPRLHVRESHHGRLLTVLWPHEQLRFTDPRTVVRVRFCGIDGLDCNSADPKGVIAGAFGFDREAITLPLPNECGDTALTPDTVIRVELEVLRMQDELDVERTRDELRRPLPFVDWPEPAERHLVTITKTLRQLTGPQ